MTSSLKKKKKKKKKNAAFRVLPFLSQVAQGPKRRIGLHPFPNGHNELETQIENSDFKNSNASERSPGGGGGGGNTKDPTGMCR